MKLPPHPHLHYYTTPGWTGSKGSATKFTDDDYYWTLGKCLEIEDVITLMRHIHLKHIVGGGEHHLVILGEYH